MTIASFERVGAACFMIGSGLLVGYAVLFVILLPVGGDGADYSVVVLNPHWARLTLVAFIGVLFMLAGLDALFSRMRATAGLIGTAGFLFTKITFVFQACVLTSRSCGALKMFGASSTFGGARQPSTANRCVSRIS